MNPIMAIKLGIYAAIFFSGVWSAYFVLSPRIDVWKIKYENTQALNAGLQLSLNEQNEKVNSLGEQSKIIIESSKNAIEQAKKDNAKHEYKITSLLSYKAPTLDLCKDASNLIDSELMQ